ILVALALTLTPGFTSLSLAQGLRVWSGWSEVPGNGLTASGPAATFFNYGDRHGQLHLFVRGTDDALYRNFRTVTGNWSGWSEVPGSGLTASGPAALAFGIWLYLFVRGYDDNTYMSYEYCCGGPAYWTGWRGLGGLTTSGPAASVNYYG